MTLTPKQSTVLKRFARTLGATVIGALIAFAGSPDLTGVLTSQESFVVAMVVIPALTALDKYVRFGSDAGEGAPESADAKA